MKNICFILLPGFTPHNKLVTNTKETFARQGYDTIAINFWGEESAPKFEELTIDDCVQGVRKTIEATCKKYTYVVGIGFSLGGAMLFEYAKTSSDLHMIVSAGTPFKLQWKPLIKLGFLLYPLSYFIWKMKKGNMDFPVPAAKTIYAYLNDEFGKGIETIKTPTLLIHSKTDALSSSRAMSDFFKRLGSTTKDLVYIQNASHVIEANGHIIYDLLSEFLESTHDAVQLRALVQKDTEHASG